MEVGYRCRYTEGEFVIFASGADKVIDEIDGRGARDMLDEIIVKMEFTSALRCLVIYLNFTFYNRYRTNSVSRKNPV